MAGMSAKSASSPAGYVYEFGPVQGTYADQAKAHCESLQPPAQLPILKNAAEAEFLKQYILENEPHPVQASYYHYWLGYRWEEGGWVPPLANYSNWEEGEPSGGECENEMNACVELYSTTWKWNDITCGSGCLAKFKNGVICQRKGLLSATSELSPDDNVYELYPVQGTYADQAKAYCESLEPPAQLPVLRSAEETEFLKQYITQNAETLHGAYWLGYRKGKDGWDRGDNPTLSTYSNWAAGQPDEGSCTGCVEMNSTTGQWNDNACAAECDAHYKNGVVCQRRVSAKSAPSPAGYVYEFGPVQGTYADQAKAHCESLQPPAQLPILKNAAEAEFLKQYILENEPHPVQASYYHYWLGYRWEEGGWVPPLANYSNWEEGEPSGGECENEMNACVELYSTTWKWNDITCGSGCLAKFKNGVICQRKEDEGGDIGSGEGGGATPTDPEVVAPDGIRCFGDSVEGTGKIEREELGCDVGDAVCYGSKCKAICEANEDCQIYTVHVGGGGCFLQRLTADCGPFEESDGSEWISGYSKHGHPPALQVDESADNRFFETTLQRIQEGCEQVCQMLSTVNDRNPQACKQYKEYDNGACFLYTD